MASFTKKVLGLAGVASVFAGMAFGAIVPAVCVAPTIPAPIIIRAEGTAEQLPSFTFTCTAPTTDRTAAGTASLQLFLSLPVTSRVTTAPATEARLVMSGTVPAIAQTISGTVSGSTVTFSGITLPASTADAQTIIFTVDSIRVNATSLVVGAGVPPSVTITPYITGTATSVPTAAFGAMSAAFGQNGLSAMAIYPTFNTYLSGHAPAGTLTANNFPTGTSTGTANTANSFVICNAVKPSAGTLVAGASTAIGKAAGLAFVAKIGENFTSAFKTAGLESSPSVTALVNGTRLSLNFTNVPAGVTLYVPNAAIQSTTSNTSTIQLAPWANGTAPTTPTGGVTSGSALIAGGAPIAFDNSLVAVTLTAGSGSVIFEAITADQNTLDSFNVPVYAVTTANVPSASTTGIGVSVNFAPVGVTTVPNFIVAANSNTVTGTTFSTCTTSLLFPFVTNQSGFDTGIAISNTSTDPFGTKGATAQAGTCSLSFYGSGAPTPASVTTANVATGTVITQILSGVAAGFQGYMVAQCNFQYAHGFAFLTNAAASNNAVAQGYLAGVIPDTNQANRAASPLSAAAAGTGESLGN